MMVQRKILVAILFLICGVAILIAVYLRFFRNGFLKASTAGLSVESPYGQSTVILDGSLVGKTPYKSEALKAGEHSLSIKGDYGSYDTKIKLVPNALTSVSRDVGVGSYFTGGYTVWMEKIAQSKASLSVVSNPEGATVKLDQSEVGKSPKALDNVPEGPHTLEIAKDAFESQTLSIKMKKGFKLNVISDLFLFPLPSKLEVMDEVSTGSLKVYNMALPDIPMTLEPSSWARAIYYWSKTRGAPVTFDYFVDVGGIIYDNTGTKISVEDASKNKSDGVINVGYLSQFSQEKMTDKAKESLSSLVSGVSAGKGKIKIIPTGVGWLRMRSEPSLSSKEIGKVNVGDVFDVLGEKEGWIKVRTEQGKEGWVSAKYTEKVESSK